MKVQIRYVSGTGNTERIAQSIYQAVPITAKDVKYLDSCCENLDADTYFIGFWANRGTASMEVLDYLSELHGKNVALFGTCGMGDDAAHFKKIENNVAAFIPEDNHYLGSYFCLGKMPMRIRQKYEQMETPENAACIRKMLRGFDEALLHPNQKDLDNAAHFTSAVFEQLKHLKGQGEQL